MLFGSKPNFVVYVRRNGLSLYHGAGQAVELAFSGDVVQYSEVLDGPKLRELAGQFFAAQKGMAKQKGVILLDDWIVFQKVLPIAQGLDIKKAQTDFESKVPFDPEDRSILSLQTKDQLVLLGTSKELYRAIGEALQALGCKLVSVCPAVVYGVRETEKLTPALVQKVLGNTSLAERANFVNGEHSLLT